MRLRFLFVFLASMLFASPLWAEQSVAAAHDDAPSESSHQKSADINPGDLLIGHVSDAHSWHILDYHGRDGRHHVIGINLPIILLNDGRLDCFSSKHFHHGEADYRGYRLVGGGVAKEEIVCVDDQGNLLLRADGSVQKPIDLSITKTAMAVLIAVALLIGVVLYSARRYKKTGVGAPHGLQSLVEMLVLHVRNDIVQPMLGHHTDRYLPYLLTLFFFIFFCNILGLIPFFPAGANITGNIAVTCVLALITFFITNLSGNKHYWKDIFNTPGVPAWLKIFPLMPIVEFVGVITKPVVLMIRLFANMTAGHIVILGFLTLIFMFSNLYNPYVGGAVSVVSVLFSVFIFALECLVAYIQAFVFTMLSSLYIGMAVEEPEEKEPASASEQAE